MSTLEEDRLRTEEAELVERHEAYMGRLRWFATRLDAAADGNPVARAVCDHHSIDEAYGTTYCTGCIGNEYGDDWPCPTIGAVADALGIEVPIA